MNHGNGTDVPLIAVENITRVYGQGENATQVLKGISLSIRSGEFVAIIGQSGSGKTTLMNILGCLDRPDSGAYRVKGADVSALGPNALATLRREVFGFVFQKYNLLAGGTARENVEMPALYAGRTAEERRARASMLLTRLGLEQRLDFVPAKLSGGQQQRVSIARALMNGGEIILADEPTGALDKKSGEDVLALLEELHAAGHTIILITHDSGVAARARRTIALSDGNIISDTGSPETLPRRADPSGESGRAGEAKQAAPPRPAAALTASMRIAARALRDNRFRTMLTLLGIIIGVASVVTMLALGNGAKARVLSNIAAMGSNVITVQGPGASSRTASGPVHLYDADVEAMRALPGVLAVVGEDSGTVSVRYQEADYQTSYIATGVGKPIVSNWAVARGEFFTENDVAGHAPVAVLGQTVVKHIFPEDVDPIGAYIMIRNVPFLVIGVMEAKGASAFGNDEDDVLLLPGTTARLRLMGKKNLSRAVLKAESDEAMTPLQTAIGELMRERHHRDDFRIRNTAAIMAAASESQETLTLLLGSVAAISLLVGGIGVMNIMLVSVVERTREIGIRMACGARQKDILTQFITEALMVCTFGGLLGILAGLSAAFAAQQSGTPVQYSLPPVMLAFGCSLGTGLVFGLAPARKAARLDPVAALASE